jgi:predicted transcriptional regulator
MSKQRTKDENFILQLYLEAEKCGNFDQSFDRYEVGERSHLNPKAVDTICKLLVQANFIKKADESQIYLTPHGQGLVRRLRAERL